ncbi:MAG: hypothetical protein M1819_006876 [Sarea resinae]|nr:MAG: hypothetical protein M1819_006876 [Sarea resinae]
MDSVDDAKAASVAMSLADPMAKADPSAEPSATIPAPESQPGQSAAQAGGQPQRVGDDNNSRRSESGAHRGSRGGARGKGDHRDRGRGGKRKGKDLGRLEYFRTRLDKRAQNEAEQAAKRQKVESGEGTSEGPAPAFSQEEIANEERRPKRKVAVLIGYSGSGYKGMQLNGAEKTIEGDLFSAFVAASAISKANADDPKKSSLVRCARTDKGVHAAGNVISLKLIVEDPDIVKKINENLSPQIRVWGIERTNGSFSCYQTCDSRIYEYLIPTHSFLPPHPSSYLGKKLVELAEEAGDSEGFEKRQEEVSSFWAETEAKYIKPILETLDDKTQSLVLKALYDSEVDPEAPIEPKSEVEDPEGDPESRKLEHMHLDSAIKSLKAAYLTAKKAHRIPPKRLERVRETLNLYLGTKNFHNYTIKKNFKDPSAKRVIRSFVVGEKPVIINDTEWLSLKVHGQSFMMHQIRKMVSMAALVVRCGCPPVRITDTYGPETVNIPKAPGLGLLLERPIFDSYNERAVSKLNREKIDFGKFETEMEEFKQREIYERIFREEESDNKFHSFFAHIDNFKSELFLYVSSAGLPASRKAASSQPATEQSTKVEVDSEDDAAGDNQEG